MGRCSFPHPRVGFLFLCRAGDDAGVVVGNRMHSVHWPGYGGQVRQGARHHHPQPQLWNRLPVWLDHVWKIRRLRGQLKPRTVTGVLVMFVFISFLFWCTLLLLELKSAGQAWAAEGSSDRLDLVLSGNCFLQTKVGGGPKYGLRWAGKAQRLSWIYVGKRRRTARPPWIHKYIYYFNFFLKYCLNETFC